MRSTTAVFFLSISLFRAFILSCLILVYIGWPVLCLLQKRNNKIVPKCYVLCYRATSSREGLLLLHSLVHSPVEILTYLSRSSGGSGKHHAWHWKRQPEATGPSTATAPDQHLHRSSSPGQGVWLSSRWWNKSSWPSQITGILNCFDEIAFMWVRACSDTVPRQVQGRAALLQKTGLFKQLGLYQLCSFKS